MTPPIVSLVGKSGVGKTTLLEQLIPALKRCGLRVGVVKHHGHASGFDQPGKDTQRHAAAGADVVIGISPVQVAAFYQVNAAPDVAAMVARLGAGVDLVLTEGFSRGPFPKIEINRAARSASLLFEPAALLAVVSDQAFDLPIPCFGLDAAEALADFLLAWSRTG